MPTNNFMDFPDFSPLIFLFNIFVPLPIIYFIILFNRYFYNGLTLHFIGIRRPSTFSKSQYKLLDNIDSQSMMITIKTSLKPTDSILSLKNLIKTTYNIQSTNDILILYAHHTISYSVNELLPLSAFGITNNSLLTLAVADDERITAPERDPTPGPVQIEEEEEEEEESSSEDHGNEVNQLFSMYDSDSDSEEEEEEEKEEEIKEPEPEIDTTPYPRPGFDIITQENDVLVHKMPICGHEMNHESLYYYALSTFSDSNNLHLRCPHSTPTNPPKPCNTKWKYAQIYDILNHQDPKEEEQKNKWINTAKLELLSGRNTIQNECDVQKCPRCLTVYYKNYDSNKIQLEDIKTVTDIEQEFKYKCLFCPDGETEIEVKEAVETPNKEQKIEEEEEEEDIDGAAVSAIFGMYESDDSDDSDDDQEEEKETEPVSSINELFAMFQDDDEPDYIYTKKMKSHNAFCWCCGSEWIDGHICDSSFKEDLVEILQNAELKKIGSVEDVPSIRSCPNCCQLLFHVDACKHMKCRGCKEDFCFVCMKPKLNGSWQCGSHCDKCPVAPKQNINDLPNTIVITKKGFQLF